MNFGKFVTIRKKKKAVSTVGINTERSSQLLAKLDSLQESALQLKKKIDQRSLSGNFGNYSKFSSSRECVIREEDDAYWYDLHDLKSFRISSVRSLFNLNFNCTGRFTPPNENLLELSFESVSFNLRRARSVPDSLLNFCTALGNNQICESDTNILNKSIGTVQTNIRKGNHIRKHIRRQKKFLKYLDFCKILPSKPKTRLPELKLDRKLGRYSAEYSAPCTSSSFLNSPLLNKKGSPVITELKTADISNLPNAEPLSSTIIMDSDLVDNKVVKWYIQLIPVLEIPHKDRSATLINDFIVRCKHVFERLNETQQKTFLFTIISRISNPVIKKLNKLSFSSLEDLEHSLKSSHPHAPNRELILEEIRQCRQRNEETFDDFVSRLRELLERGQSEDNKDSEYEIAAKLALKKV